MPVNLRKTIFLVGSPDDKLLDLMEARSLTEGLTPIRATHSEFGLMTSVSVFGGKSCVRPDIPVMLRPPSPGTAVSDDGLFLAGEVHAHVWAVCAAARSPVINRPNVNQFLNPALAAVIRRLNENSRLAALFIPEHYISSLDVGKLVIDSDGESLEIQEMAGGRTYLLEGDLLHRCADVPVRVRRRPGRCSYLRTIVVGRDVWSSSGDLARHGRYIERSGEIAASLGINFCAIVWRVNDESGDAQIAQINPSPRYGDLLGQADDIAHQILKLMIK